MTERTRIFLAHAREDKPRVLRLYDDLKKHGFDPWLDEQDLRAGQIWRTEISKAIREAKLFLACLSSRAVGKIGFVQSEFREALAAYGERPAGSVYLVPVRLDDCEVPDLQIPSRGLSLRDFQWIDLWRDDGFDRLVRDVEFALRLATVPPLVKCKPTKADSIETRRVTFATAIVVLGAKLAKADGLVTQEEIRAFKRTFRVDDHDVGDVGEVGRIYNQAKTTAQGFEPYARQIAGLFGNDPILLEELLVGLFEVARADGELNPAEINFLRRVAAIFGFDNTAFEKIRALKSP